MGWIHRPYLSPVDPIFLQSLLVIRVFGTGFKDVSDVTEDIIMAMLTELSSGSMPVSFDEALFDVKRNPALKSLNPRANPHSHAPSQ